MKEQNETNRNNACKIEFKIYQEFNGLLTASVQFRDKMLELAEIKADKNGLDAFLLAAGFVQQKVLSAMTTFKIKEVQTGLCRIVYTTRNDKNESITYCIQAVDKKDYEFFRCSQDGEPSHEVKPKNVNLWELPHRYSKLEDEIRDFLLKQRS